MESICIVNGWFSMGYDTQLVIEKPQYLYFDNLEGVFIEKSKNENLDNSTSDQKITKEPFH